MMKNKVFYWIAHITPYAFIVAVPVGIIFAILLQKITYALYGLTIGVPILLAVFLILMIQKNDPDFTGSCVLFPSNQQSLIRIFLIIFIVSFIVTLLSGILATLFLFLIVILYCVILIQIFSKNPSPWIIIIEILLTLILLIYTTTLTSSYYFGYTDIIPHVSMATITSLTGHIIPLDSSGYSYFPLYHIWIASGSLITGINSYQSIIILTGPVFAISVIFIYFLFNRVIKNQQIALLTCLLYSSSSIVMFYGTYVVTRTMAFIGFIILLYLLYNAKVTKINNLGLIFKSLAIIISVFIMLVHQVSTPMILLLLIILLLCEWIVDQQKYIRTNFTILLISIFFSYWLFYANSFTSFLITSRIEAEKFEVPSFIVLQNPTPPIVFFTNNIHMMIFVFFGIIGILYTILKKKLTYTSVFGLFALLTIFLYIPSPLQTLWQTIKLLRFDRFQLIILPFMVLIMALGIWVVIMYLSQNKISVKIISFIILFCFLIFSCSSIGLIHYNENSSLRFSFNAEELVGFNFLQKNIPSNSHIFSDYFTSKYFEKPFFSIPITNITSLSLNSGYFVIAKKQFLTNGLEFSMGDELNPEGGIYSFYPIKDNIRNLYLGLYSKNQIYSSDSIEVYES
jgi:hypothetical protein